MKHPPKVASSSQRRQVDRTHPAVILLQPEEGALPREGGTRLLRALTVLLAQTLAADFGDRTLVIHVTPPEPSVDEAWHASAGPPSLSPSTSIAGPMSQGQGIQTDAGRADHLDLPAPVDPRGAADALGARLRQLFQTYAYVFVDAAARGAPFGRSLAEELGAVDLEGAVRRLVVVTRQAEDWSVFGERPPPSAAAVSMMPVAAAPWSVLRSRVLGPLPPRAAPPPVRRGLRHRLADARVLAGQLLERLGGEAIEPHGEPYPHMRVTPEQARVRLDLAAVAAQGEVPLVARLPEAARRSFSRWARAVSWRRVGVALGGSGAWGYAHVALLQELEGRGVPMDIIGGSSSGSLMGAYYSVLGREGLDLAVARGPRFERLALASTITSTMIDLGVDADLGGMLLEDLELMLLPVATNLSHARAEVMTRSTVASAVRASASAPGVFASTITRAGLYVDGAVTDNVPVLLVERMGADLLFACNPLPPPPSVQVRTPGSPLSDFLAELNPVHRVRDLMVSFELMFHDFGTCEDADWRVVYEPPAETGALFRTFNYGSARALVDAVKGEESFCGHVQRCERAWKRMARPRVV